MQCVKQATECVFNSVVPDDGALECTETSWNKIQIICINKACQSL